MTHVIGSVFGFNPLFTALTNWILCCVSACLKVRVCIKSGSRFLPVGVAVFEYLLILGYVVTHLNPAKLLSSFSSIIVKSCVLSSFIVLF